MKSLYLLLVLVLGLFIFPGISHAKKGDVCNPKAPGCNAVYEECPKTLKQMVVIASTSKFKFSPLWGKKVQHLTTSSSWFAGKAIKCCLSAGHGIYDPSRCVASRKEFKNCEKVSKYHKFKCIPK
mgnify:CR=1 FL=1